MPKKLAPIIIKRIKKKGGHAHHGGGWKIAYADFVTAMMAFFLMMWLLNAVSDDQKKGIADYFSPNIVTMEFRQSGPGVLGGMSLNGKKSTRYDKPHPQAMNHYDRGKSLQPQGEHADGDGDQKHIRLLTREEIQREDEEKLEVMEQKKEDSGGLSDFQKSEQEEFRRVMGKIENMLEEHELWRDHIQTEITRDGLVINVLEKEKAPMFTSGSAVLVKYTQDILHGLAEIFKGIKNKIIISGHTDAYNYTNENLYSNWELSCDRANSARRYLMKQGIHKSRFFRVEGLEAREPLNPDNIYAPENRRVRFTIWRDYELTLDQLKSLENQQGSMQAVKQVNQPIQEEITPNKTPDKNEATTGESAEA